MSAMRGANYKQDRSLLYSFKKTSQPNALQQPIHRKGQWTAVNVFALSVIMVSIESSVNSLHNVYASWPVSKLIDFLCTIHTHTHTVQSLALLV